MTVWCEVELVGVHLVEMIPTRTSLPSSSPKDTPSAAIILHNEQRNDIFRSCSGESGRGGRGTGEDMKTNKKDSCAGSLPCSQLLSSVSRIPPGKRRGQCSRDLHFLKERVRMTPKLYYCGGSQAAELIHSVFSFLTMSANPSCADLNHKLDGYSRESSKMPTHSAGFVVDYSWQGGDCRPMQILPTYKNSYSVTYSTLRYFMPIEDF